MGNAWLSVSGFLICACCLLVISWYQMSVSQSTESSRLNIILSTTFFHLLFFSLIAPFEFAFPLFYFIYFCLLSFLNKLLFLFSLFPFLYLLFGDMLSLFFGLFMFSVGRHFLWSSPHQNFLWISRDFSVNLYLLHSD